jgi:hypothetical protein
MQREAKLKRDVITPVPPSPSFFFCCLCQGRPRKRAQRRIRSHVKNYQTMTSILSVSVVMAALNTSATLDEAMCSILDERWQEFE